MTIGVNNNTSLLLLEERAMDLPDDLILMDARILTNAGVASQDDALDSFCCWERPEHLRMSASGAEILTVLKEEMNGIRVYDRCLHREDLYALARLGVAGFLERFGESKVCAFGSILLDDETGDFMVPYLFVQDNTLMLAAKRLASDAWDPTYEVGLMHEAPPSTAVS